MYLPLQPTMIKSPLRYLGGKSRAIPQLKHLIPSDIQKYREPFVGGSSFFIYLRQAYPTLKIWINELNPELYHFWQLPNKTRNNSRKHSSK